MVSGFRINPNKSELGRIGGNGDVSDFAKVLGCKSVSFPMKYLGVPLGVIYKDKITWEPVIELFKLVVGR